MRAGPGHQGHDAEGRVYAQRACVPGAWPCVWGVSRREARPWLVEVLAEEGTRPTEGGGSPPHRGPMSTPPAARGAPGEKAAWWKQQHVSGGASVGPGAPAQMQASGTPPIPAASLPWSST